MTISKVNQLKLMLFKNDEPQDANPNTVSISFYTTVLIFETGRLLNGQPTLHKSSTLSGRPGNLRSSVDPSPTKSPLKIVC